MAGQQTTIVTAVSDSTQTARKDLECLLSKKPSSTGNLSTQCNRVIASIASDSVVDNTEQARLDSLTRFRENDPSFDSNMVILLSRSLRFVLYIPLERGISEHLQSLPSNKIRAGQIRAYHSVLARRGKLSYKIGNKTMTEDEVYRELLKVMNKYVTQGEFTLKLSEGAAVLHIKAHDGTKFHLSTRWLVEIILGNLPSPAEQPSIPEHLHKPTKHPPPSPRCPQHPSDKDNTIET